jgi:putative endonuclease
MRKSRQSLGRWGESVAARYLQSQDYQILERNARTPYGEIDIVAIQQSVVSQVCDDQPPVTVFIEVKTRTSTAFGFPEESITMRKQSHMLAAAESYIQEHPELGNDWRIDVIAIQCLGSTKKHSLKHFENVIT